MAYRALSLLLSTLGGLIAGVLFKQLWKRVAGQDDAPDADDRNYSWRQILIAATLQGAIFGFVKAVVQRLGAHAVRKSTGRWPNDDD